MMWVLLAPAFALGAVGRRLCGGLFVTWFGWSPGLQVERLLWALLLVAPYALVRQIGGHGDWIFAATLLGYVVAFFVGSTAGYLPGAMRPTTVAEFFDSLLHGVLGVALAAALAFWVGDAWWILAGAAVSCPLAYTLSQLVSFRWPLFACLPQDPAPLGELLYGGSLGAAMLACAIIQP